MKYIREFRDGDLAGGLSAEIAVIAEGSPVMRFMEVCGTHTMAIHRYGIKKLLPQNIILVSGPGCPVCVTANGYIDRAVALTRLEDVTLCTFGDMLRVPGSSSSLELEKARGGDVRIVYSPLDAVEIAQRNRNRRVVFMGVGFETTAPTVAAAVLTANRLGVTNYFVSVAHKTMPQALLSLVHDGEIDLNGFILPAHVSAIIGVEPYRFLADQFCQACVITGFEPLDILLGILMLLRQVVRKDIKVEIQYRRAVRKEGNLKAVQLMERVFEPCAVEWRGLGIIAGSGLRLRDEFRKYDADRNIEVEVEGGRENRACICGAILKGVKTPRQCPLFASCCTPENPVGACMVSSEGTCAAFYKYSENLD